MTAEAKCLKFSVAFTGMRNTRSRTALRTGSETNYVSQQLLPLNHVNLCSRLEHLAVSDGLFVSAFLSLNDFACLADPSFIHLELSGGSGDF